MKTNTLFHVMSPFMAIKNETVNLSDAMTELNIRPNPTKVITGKWEYKSTARGTKLKQHKHDTLK